MAATPDRVLVATGHRIDPPDREAPRFPPELEPAVREALLRAVREERERAGGELRGLASLASGTDVLFHEVCAESGVPTRAVLALPKEEFVRKSVADGGPGWVARFERLYQRLAPVEMPEPPPGASPFQRANRWLLDQAFARPDAAVTLLAVWDRAPGDGHGGTADMVAAARERGARIVVLDEPFR